MEADNIGIYSALLFQCQFTGCMLVNLKFICTEWVSLLVLFRRSLVLLGGCTSLGRVDGFPVMNSEGSCLNRLIFLRLFNFTLLLQIKYFSRLYSKFVCLWHVFSGRERLYRYNKFNTLPIYPEGSFQVTCLYCWDCRGPSVGLSFSCKFNFSYFSFNGFRMRTCNARP